MNSDSDEEPEIKIFKGDEDLNQENSDVEDIGFEDLLNMEPDLASHTFEGFGDGEKIFEILEERVKELSVLTEQSPSTILVLLNHLKWVDSARFQEAYFGNEKQLQEAANVLPKDGTKQPDAPECRICLVPAQTSSKLACGHRICDEDFREYLRMKIEDGSGLLIECPVSGCETIVPYEVVESIVEPNTMQKYRRNIAILFVVVNPKMQFCPGAGCDKFAVLGPGSHSSELCLALKCDCGMSFCFNCGKESHVPITCSLLVKWLAKCSDDSATCTWMAANTKDCPKCKTMIEKNGGCNHMTCRNKACGHHFCWICLGDWNNHQGDAYSCNRFNAEKATNAGEARLELERYLHYFNRFANHRESFKLEDKLTSIVQEKMACFQNKFNMSWVDVQFLANAGDILRRCRRTLMYTYSFAYFVEKSNSLEIFENNQRDLESATERLSDQLENHLETIGSDVEPELFKSMIINISCYCDVRCDKLINHVREGYLSNTWTFH